MQSKSYKRIFYPILAYSELEKKSQDKILFIWDSFDILSSFNKEKLTSNDTAKKIVAIVNFFKLSNEQISSISRAIRNYYFGELSLQKFPETFQREMEIDSETAQKISNQVIEKIIKDDSFEKEYQKNIDKINIKKALAKYPKINEQILGEEKIVIKNNFNPVLPTIKNWLSDYISNLGYEKHDSIKRSRYLFQSQNGKKIDEENREKLAIVLKSFDEESFLEINKKEQKIIFPKKVKKEPIRQKNKGKENVQNEKFNFHQKMPFEKELPPFRITPDFTRKKMTQRKNFQKKPSKKAVIPKNLVDLKDLK